MVGIPLLSEVLDHSILNFGLKRREKGALIEYPSNVGNLYKLPVMA